MRSLLPFVLLPIAAACFLAGCATQSQQAQTDPAAVDDAKCQAAGYHPGTPDYEKCRTKVADMRAQAQAQAEVDSRAALAGRLQGRPPPWSDTSGPPKL